MWVTSQGVVNEPAPVYVTTVSHGHHYQGAPSTVPQGQDFVTGHRTVGSDGTID